MSRALPTVGCLCISSLFLFPGSDLICRASAAEQHLVFISDTQYPWTDKSDNGTPEDEKTTMKRSRKFILDQGESTRQFREAHGGLDKVPLFLNGDITAYGHGWQREFMYDAPFKQKYVRNFYVGLGNHDYGNNVDNCSNNGCARDMYLDMLGWAEKYPYWDFDYATMRRGGAGPLLRRGSLAYSMVFGKLMVIQLQNEPTYEVKLTSNSSSFKADVTSSLEYLRRQLEWARIAGRDVILSMHKPPYAQWSSPDNKAFGQLLKDNRDIILAIFAGHLHKKHGLYRTVEGIPVYLSGAAHYSTWLAARYDPDARTLKVGLVKDNDWRKSTLAGESAAAAARAYVAIPDYRDFGSHQWGTWGDVATCRDGHYIFGMSVKGEPPLGNGDDTGLNAVRFRCAPRGEHGQQELVSKESPWGVWDEFQSCPNYGYAIGVQMRIEKNQGQHDDDTAMTNLRLLCSGGWTLTGTPPAQWGDWGREHRCPAGMALAGFVSKVEDDQGVDDDTALNRIQMFCRKMP